MLLALGFIFGIMGLGTMLLVQKAFRQAKGFLETRPRVKTRFDIFGITHTHSIAHTYLRGVLLSPAKEFAALRLTSLSTTSYGCQVPPSAPVLTVPPAA